AAMTSPKKPQGLGAIPGLLWIGVDEAPIGRLLAFGAIVWGAYSVVQILINGVVLDEVIEPAQIITGAVSYPAGHPHQIYFLKTYNLFHDLAAGLMALKFDAILISALRNWLYLFMSAFTPFALTVSLTKRPAWGHLASVLALTETMVRFGGAYPIF